MKIRHTVLLVLLSCAATSFGSDASQQPPNLDKPLFRADILLLLSSGVSIPDIVKRVEQRGVAFEATEEHLQSLRAAGADESLLNAVRAAHRASTAEAEPSAAIHAARGQELAAHANLDAAIGEFREAVRLNPDQASTRVLLAQALRSKAEHKLALEELRIATLLSPSDLAVRAATLRAQREVLQPATPGEHPASAGPRAEKVWTSDDFKTSGGGNSPLSAEIAAVTESAQTTEEAPPKASGTAPLPPSPPPPQTQGGRPVITLEHARCLEALRRPDAGKAESACKDYARRSPDDPDARYFACLALRSNAHADSAVSECKAAVALRPDDPRLHTSLGETYLAKLEPDSAITAFRKALQLNANYAQAHHGLGRAYRAKLDRKAALEHYDKAHRLNPGLPNLHVEYCSLLDEASKMPLGTSYLPSGWLEVYKTCRFTRYNY